MEQMEKLHHPLGFFPTPIHRLKRLEETLNGPKLYIKRDDQTGLCLGGNKTRKLEYFIGDALIKGSNCLITAGAAQSNHCRQTAAAGAVCGLETHLLLGGTEPSKRRGNLLLNTIVNANIHWSGDDRKGEQIPELVTRLHKEGKKPYVIPYGGSNHIGALGFVSAFLEINEQMKQLDHNIDHIVFASSSGGTHSGLMIGKALLQSTTSLYGINIDKDEVFGMKLKDYILKLSNETTQFLGQPQKFTDNDLSLNGDYTGQGYGIVGNLEKEAINMLGKYEGILLDPVYTGRAFGALIDLIRNDFFSRNETVLFYHTGGIPALFAHED